MRDLPYFIIHKVSLYIEVNIYKRNQFDTRCRSERIAQLIGDTSSLRCIIVRQMFTFRYQFNKDEKLEFFLHTRYLSSWKKLLNITLW
jgi:hypothetical protein